MHSSETQDPIHMIDERETYVAKFRLRGLKTIFKFSKPPSGISELDWIRKGFNQIVEKAKAEASPTDYLGFTLHSLNLKSKEPGYVSIRPASEINSDILWKIFGGIVQSNSDSITSSDTFRVDVTRVNVPRGKGRVRPQMYNTFDEECKARKGIVLIANKDNLCLARALVVGKAFAKKDPDYELIRKDRRGRQTIKASKLIAKARVEMPEEGAGIPELEKFQSHLKKYKITVYKYGTKGRDVYFSGGLEDAKFNINLLFHNGHFNVITNLTAAFGCIYFCEACHVPYEHKAEHRCANRCTSCHSISPPCKLEHGGITCRLCSRFFKNERCFIAHQGQICKTIK